MPLLNSTTKNHFVQKSTKKKDIWFMIIWYSIYTCSWINFTYHQTSKNGKSRNQPNSILRNCINKRLFQTGLTQREKSHKIDKWFIVRFSLLNSNTFSNHIYLINCGLQIAKERICSHGFWNFVMIIVHFSSGWIAHLFSFFI